MALEKSVYIFGRIKSCLNFQGTILLFGGVEVEEYSEEDISLSKSYYAPLSPETTQLGYSVVHKGALYTPCCGSEGCQGRMVRIQVYDGKKVGISGAQI